MANQVVSRFPGVKRANRLVTNLGISLITLVFLLVASELAFRYVYRDMTTTADTRTYFARRWWRTIRVNSRGFRERDFELTKPEGIYRIAVIGDSITFGQGIEEEDRFTNLLEEQLNSTDGNYEVLNFGRAGAETTHHLQFLEGAVLDSDPDYVLLQWFVNDVEGEDKSQRPQPLTLIPVELREASVSFTLLHGVWMRAQQGFGWVGSYEEYMLAQFGDRESAASLAAEETMRDFTTTSKEYGIPLGMVLFGEYYSHSSSLDFLVQRVMELCKEEGIRCVDLRSTFAPYKGNEVLWVNWADHHPSPLAHKLVADQLMETYGETWIRR